MEIDLTPQAVPDGARSVIDYGFADMSTKLEEKQNLDTKIKAFERKYRDKIHEGCLTKTTKENYTNLLRKRLNYGGICTIRHAVFLLQIEGLTEEEPFGETGLKLLKGKREQDNKFVSMYLLYCKECSFMCSKYKKNIPKHTEEVCNSDIAKDEDTFNELIEEYKNKITEERPLHKELPPEIRARYYVYCLMNEVIIDAENIRLSDVRSIFYIGYGTETRPLQHFEADCLKERTTPPQEGKFFKKNSKIREVWNDGKKVVIYKMGPLMLLEAIRMEAVLINVLQLKLTNQRIPQLSDFGIINWSKQDRLDYAIHLLHELFTTDPTQKSSPWLDEPGESPESTPDSSKKTSKFSKKTPETPEETIMTPTKATKSTPDSSKKTSKISKKTPETPDKTIMTPTKATKSTPDSSKKIAKVNIKK